VRMWLPVFVSAYSKHDEREMRETDPFDTQHALLVGSLIQDV
jgi:hypothetical protein